MPSRGSANIANLNRKDIVSKAKTESRLQESQISLKVANLAKSKRRSHKVEGRPSARRKYRKSSKAIVARIANITKVANLAKDKTTKEKQRGTEGLKRPQI